MNQQINTQNGNVLFIILIAVILFAALSFAISQSTRGGGGNMSKEDIELAASEILQHASTTRQGFERLRARGCSINQINFANNTYVSIDGSLSAQVNTLSPPDGSCDMYSANGAGVIPRILKSGYHSDTASCAAPAANFSPGVMIARVQPTPMQGTSSNDLVLFSPGIREDVCRRINEKVAGNPIYPPGVTPGQNYLGYNLNAAVPISTVDPALQGFSEWCYEHSTAINGCSVTAGYRGIFVMVLHPR